MDSDKKQERLGKRRERDRQARAHETAEQSDKRLGKRREQDRQARAHETAEQKEIRLAKRRQKCRARRIEGTYVHAQKVLVSCIINVIFVETAQARQARMDANRTTQQLGRNTQTCEATQARLQQDAGSTRSRRASGKYYLI